MMTVNPAPATAPQAWKSISPAHVLMLEGSITSAKGVGVTLAKADRLEDKLLDGVDVGGEEVEEGPDRGPEAI